MTKGEIRNAAANYVGSNVLLFSDGEATMNEPMMPQTLTLQCGHSSRLVRARRYFVEAYLRFHDFVEVDSHVDDISVVFTMIADGRPYSLRVSQAWMVSSTHARVEERLDRLQASRMLREHGAAYLDVTTIGQEVLSRS